jgi:hypothetical protein
MRGVGAVALAIGLTGCVRAANPDTISLQAEASELRALVPQIAESLEDGYVIPAIGARYAAMLRSNLSKGRYNGIVNRAEFAKMVTTDLQAVAADGHLRIVEDDSRGGPRAGSQSSPPEGRPGNLFPRAPALEEPKWISEGVAYLRFNEFPPDPGVTAAVAQFMRDHAAAKSIIIDARKLRGGGLQQMNVMLPYLFSQETTLLVMDLPEAVIAKRGPPPDIDDPSLRRIAGPVGILRRAHVIQPHPTEHRLFGAKVFYLISGRTASAGEHLALALKRTRRGVLIGEHTAGANHFGGMEPVGSGLSLFLPVGRTLDPDTGEDWEGRGIEPDISVTADGALEEALRLSEVN